MRDFKEQVFLTPTDTTIGFVSQNSDRIDCIKQRPASKYYIIALPTLQALKSKTRVPDKYHNIVRRARKTTFILPDGNSYRVIRGQAHTHLLNRLGWSYTTSANLSGHGYDAAFAKSAADIIVGMPSKTGQGTASRILKINNRTVRRVR